MNVNKNFLSGSLVSQLVSILCVILIFANPEEFLLGLRVSWPPSFSRIPSANVPALEESGEALQMWARQLPESVEDCGPQGQDAVDMEAVWYRC